ncbi:MAG: Undecaprenyl-phosphate 4-deoxy-4-formamido-L-arabinose transferase [Phycisphaerae bacterium]|nr:Undecaprenyl-phosphate 4-deoxy-4-formamido-L-arabinose transferase [Phycisphaerae bacterium]
MTSDSISISVFFPCHNEEGNVERTTRQAVSVCRQISSDFEVIIVNDGSKDRTAEIADQLAGEIPEVRVIHHPTNKGYGGALQSGFRGAAKEWVFYTDGDGQFDIGELPKLLPLRGPKVIVSAYRQNRQDSRMRKLNAWCWGKLVNTLFGMRVRDIDGAFKLYPRTLFEQIELRSMGALIDTEVLAKATRLGYEIRQLGVNHYPRVSGQQSGANLKVILRAFRELFKLRKHILETMPRSSHN